MRLQALKTALVQNLPAGYWGAGGNPLPHISAISLQNHTKLTCLLLRHRERKTGQ